MLRTSFIYSIVRLTSISSPEACRRPGRVGQERFELSTPRLSSVCSNQLSYWPVGLIGLSRPNSKPWHQPRGVSVDRCGLNSIGHEQTTNHSFSTFEIDRNRLDRSQRQDSRKEVIQPQVPLRLPCYDLVPIRSCGLGACLLAVSTATWPSPPFRGLTGGVYKAQEHIHRSVADLRLLAIPTSRRRVAAFDLNWGELHDVAAIRPAGGLVGTFQKNVWS